jgi:hypothetical protein
MTLQVSATIRRLILISLAYVTSSLALLALLQTQHSKALMKVLDECDV